MTGNKLFGEKSAAGNDDAHANYQTDFRTDYHSLQDKSYKGFMDSELSDYKSLLRKEKREQRRRNRTGRKVAAAIGAAAAALGPPVFADGMPPETGIPNDGYVDIVVMDFENGSTYSSSNYNPSGLSKSISAAIAARLATDESDNIRIVSPRKLMGVLSKYNLSLEDFYRNPFCLEQRGERVIDGFIEGSYSVRIEGNGGIYLTVDSGFVPMSSGMVEETQLARGTHLEENLVVGRIVDQIKADLARGDYD